MYPLDLSSRLYELHAAEKEAYQQRLFEVLDAIHQAQGLYTYGFPYADEGKDDLKNWGIVFVADGIRKHIPIIRVYELIRADSSMLQTERKYDVEGVTTVSFADRSWDIDNNKWLKMTGLVSYTESIYGGPNDWISSNPRYLKPPFPTDPRMAPIVSLEQKEATADIPRVTLYYVV